MSVFSIHFIHFTLIYFNTTLGVHYKQKHHFRVQKVFWSSGTRFMIVLKLCCVKKEVLLDKRVEPIVHVTRKRIPNFGVRKLVFHLNLFIFWRAHK